MRLGSSETCEAGRGAYLFEGGVYASTLGVKKETPHHGGGKVTIEVLPTRMQGQTIQPQVDDTVICKVTQVNPRQANCLIVCVNGQALEQDFPAVIRTADVRATDVDAVEIYKCFMPGDVVRAEVLSLGDARSYYLTTAKNSLGVISATCGVSGEVMLPISWEEMRCPATGTTEPRKVAKVAAVTAAITAAVTATAATVGSSIMSS